MPRLFTGLEIPEPLAYELSFLRGGLSGATWIDRDNYHITLRFIGDVDRALACDIADGLDNIRQQAFDVTLEQLDIFGGDKPRAIIARVRPVTPLVELQAAQERLVRRVGIAASTQRFTPHVTLARLKQSSPMAVADYLGGRGLFWARHFEAKRFVLFSSRDSVGGGPYRIEAEYPLMARPALTSSPAAPRHPAESWCR